MLSDKLKDKALHGRDLEYEAEMKFNARNLLKNAVKDLVTAMVAVEKDGFYDRDTIETIVLRSMEIYEKMLYAMSDEEFDAYLDEQLVKAIRRTRHE